MRLIDADCLRDYMWHVCGETDEEIDKGRAKWESGLWIRYKVFEEALDRQPEVEAEPVRHERWVPIDTASGKVACSYCKQIMPDMHISARCTTMPLLLEWRYCPTCGAKMDGEEDREG